MLPTSPRRLFNLAATHKLYIFSCFWAQNIQIWKFGQAPEIFRFLKNYQIVRTIASIRFQRAFNNFLILLQTQIIPVFLFGAQNGQIWIFGPAPQIFGNFWKISNYSNGLVNTLPGALNCIYVKHLLRYWFYSKIDIMDFQPTLRDHP